jgi:AAA family ATP:ADP antiporter
MLHDPDLLPSPHERRTQAWAFAWFFCLLAVNFVLRPVRETIGVVGTDDRLSWLYTGTFAATLVANSVYGIVVARFRRRSFVPAVYLFFASNLVLFCFAFAASEGRGRQVAYDVFFVWLSVFNVCAVTTFWGLLVDLFGRASAKRRFGVIAAGGTLGAIAGSQVADQGSRALGFVGLLSVAAALLVLAAFLASRVLRSAAETAESERPLRGNPLQGWRDVATSGYLRSIAGYLLLFTVVTTFVYFERRELVKAMLVTREEQTSYHARVDTWSNLLTLLAQMLGTAPLLAWAGVGRCLAFLPLVCMLGFASFAAAPTLLAVSAFEVLRRGGHFAVSKPAQEVLFTIVARDQKYKAKSFIDTAVYRGGDVLAAWCYTGLAANVGFVPTAVLAAGLSLVWGMLALALGRRHERSVAAGGPASAAVRS